MNFEHWDVLEVSLAESVLTDQMPVRQAVVYSCQIYPTIPVQYLSLALASMAAALEGDWLSGPLSQQHHLLEVYRTIVGLSSDIAVIELASSKVLRCSDLLTYWADTKDPYFVANGSLGGKR